MCYNYLKVTNWDESSSSCYSRTMSHKLTWLVLVLVFETEMRWIWGDMSPTPNVPCHQRSQVRRDMIPGPSPHGLCLCWYQGSAFIFTFRKKIKTQSHEEINNISDKISPKTFDSSLVNSSDLWKFLHVEQQTAGYVPQTSLMGCWEQKSCWSPYSQPEDPEKIIVKTLATIPNKPELGSISSRKSWHEDDLI